MPESVHETSVSALLPGVTEECRQIRLAPPSGTGLVKTEPWSTFLSRDRGSRIFQDMNVFDILDVVFGSYARRGGIAPAWRFDIAEPTVYAKRSFTRQYQESDLAFVERLMREEGLIYFFEHSGNAPSQSPGTHTMVIIDPKGACLPEVHEAPDFKP